MTKAKILLGAVAAIGAVTGALAFKVGRFHPIFYFICDLNESHKCDLPQTVTAAAVRFGTVPFSYNNHTVTNACLTASEQSCSPTNKCGTIYWQSGIIQ